MKDYVSPKYMNMIAEAKDVITASELPEGVSVEVVNNGKEDVTVFSFSLKNIFK